jgi:hypothetical protein
MQNDGQIRASDADRESVVTILREAYTDGRLTLDEFDQRTTTAYAARTWDDLRALTSDLPAEPRFAAGARPVLTPRQGTGQPSEAYPGGMVRPPMRGPVFIPFLPIALFWLVLAASIHATSILLLSVLVILFICLRLTSRRAYRRVQRQSGPPPRPGSGPI